jgi:hypothetical protein
MIRPNASPEVLSLADRLGIDAHDPAVGIVVDCRQRVDTWVHQAGGLGPGGISSMADLESLITHNLSMVVEEIHNDDDFDRLTDKYARGLGDYVFAGLRARFDDPENPAFGVLIERNTPTAADDLFVAVIDCREELTGEKFARRYFTKWHEIAHRMTTHRSSEPPAFRADEDPIETLVDAVASELGFYEPFLGPALQEALSNENWLTFEMIESIIQRVFPQASFQSTLYACMRIMPTPMVYLELADDPLTIQKVLPNSAAYGHWLFCEPSQGAVRVSEPKSLQSTRLRCGESVPEDSVFCRVASAELLYDEIEHHLCDFAPPEQGFFIGRFPSEHSAQSQADSVAHGHCGVLVHAQARRVPGKVIALVQY